jgi:RimJ/RimL family protein N-acetyltransferase
MNNPFLIGKRLYLRPIELDDAPRLVRWLNHPEVRRHLARQTPLNLIAEEAFLRKTSTSATDRVLLIVLRGGIVADLPADLPIGVIGLHGIGTPVGSCELGIAIGEPGRWGQGYGAEAIDLLLGHAFGDLALHRVALHVDADHARGITCYAKSGFVKEGTLRGHAFRDGQFVDTLSMSILAPEWLERRAKTTA